MRNGKEQQLSAQMEPPLFDVPFSWSLFSSKYIEDMSAGSC